MKKISVLCTALICSLSFCADNCWCFEVGDPEPSPSGPRVSLCAKMRNVINKNSCSIAGICCLIPTIFIAGYQIWTQHITGVSLPYSGCFPIGDVMCSEKRIIDFAQNFNAAYLVGGVHENHEGSSYICGCATQTGCLDMVKSMVKKEITIDSVSEIEPQDFVSCCVAKETCKIK